MLVEAVAVSVEAGVADVVLIGAGAVVLMDGEASATGAFVSALSGAGAGVWRGTGSLFNGARLLTRAALFAGALVALAGASVAGALTALPLEVSSAAGLASATTTGLSALATGAEAAGLDSATVAAGALDVLATSAGGRVRSSRNDPPITVAAMMPIPIPK